MNRDRKRIEMGDAYVSDEEEKHLDDKDEEDESETDSYYDSEDSYDSQNAPATPSSAGRGGNDPTNEPFSAISRKGSLLYPANNINV